jgi:predicted nucleotidyltransferase component of viral defense system
MSIKLIQERLNSYQCTSEIEEEQAIREITQEVALAALGRTDFFKHAAFQGGTCLRIFHGLNRFSEDMNFILRHSDPNFELKPHLQAMADELAAYGYHIEIIDRSKKDGAVKNAFLKDDSIGKCIQFNHAVKTGALRKIRIKLEVDTNPPSGSRMEIKYLDFPFISSVTTQDTPSMFAGKIHALLCREYVKGRDWYDFLWYISLKTAINFDFLSSALNQLGPWQGKAINVDTDWVRAELKQKIEVLDWKSTTEGVRRFVRQREQPSLNLWGKDLFLNQLAKLR